jgi:GxxExxY protein
MTENGISYLIRGAIFKTYNALGPGLYESAYEAVLLYELRKLNLRMEQQVVLPLVHEGVSMEVGYRVDIWVENKVIIEIKSVENLLEVHHKQLLTYLKLSGMKLGILVNFNTADITNSIFRKVNNL